MSTTQTNRFSHGSHPRIRFGRSRARERKSPTARATLRPIMLNTAHGPQDPNVLFKEILALPGPIHDASVYVGYLRAIYAYDYKRGVAAAEHICSVYSRVPMCLVDKARTILNERDLRITNHLRRSAKKKTKNVPSVRHPA